MFFYCYRLVRLNPFILIFSVNIVLSGCAVKYEDAAESFSNERIADDIYEERPIFNASELLPNSLLSGPLHQVEEMVSNDGRENTFSIRSEFGLINAHRTDFVAERVREVYAIAELTKITRSDAFSQGVAKAATSPLRALKSIATAPVSTVKRTVKGLGSIFSQAGELVKGRRGELDGSVARELVGFSEIKREIASALDVDAYSTNTILQEGIGEVAWAGFAGGVGLKPITSQIGGDAATAISGLKNAQTLKSFHNSKSPEILRNNNRSRLKSMSINSDIITSFLNHPWFSPRHETVIVEALFGLDGVENRGDFLEQALRSRSEERSIFLMRQAESILGFHQNVAPIKVLRRTNSTLLFFTQDGRAVSILPTDHLLWSLSSSIIADQDVFSGLIKELWITGTISNKARFEFQKRGWQIRIGLERLLPRYI